jgi:hypothetical protein
MAPCITSCCGLSLQKSVIVVGIIELVRKGPAGGEGVKGWRQ